MVKVEALKTEKVEKAIIKLTHKQLLAKIMPAIQHRLIDILERWQDGIEGEDLSEKDLKTILGVITVAEKMIGLQTKVKAEATPKTKTKAAENEALHEWEGLRLLVEKKLVGLIG